MKTVRQKQKSSKKSSRSSVKKTNGRAKNKGNGAPAPEPVAQAKPASISPEHAAYLASRKRASVSYCSSRGSLSASIVSTRTE